MNTSSQSIPVAPTQQHPPRADRRSWLGLLLVLGPALLISMDGSILYLVMPTLTNALAPTAGQALWILDSYGFAVGALLITFGNLGDRYGRRKLILFGAVVFGVGSAGAAFSPTPEWLIGFRVLMGVGGATLLPSGLGVLSELFLDLRQRSTAIGIYAATFAAGFAIGPVIGGVLLSFFDWGSVFLVNVPVVVLVVVFAPIVLRRGTRSGSGRIDVASIALSAAGLLAVVYAVKSLATEGPTWVGGGIGIAGGAILTLFVRRQARIPQPLVDLQLFKSRVFAIAITTGLLTLFAWSASAYLGGMYLQSVLGLPVLTAALLALPGAVVLTVTCILTPRLTERIGARSALVLCHFTMAAGLALLLATTTAVGIGWFVAATIVASFGFGISFALVADTAVSAVSPERAGSAGAIAEMSNELGNALGIALLGSVAAFVFRLLGPGVAPTLTETLDAATNAALIEQAKTAFVSGLHLAVVIAVVLCAALGVASLRWVPKRSRLDAAGS